MADTASTTSGRQVARAGGVSFAGSAIGAALGFGLTIVIARTLGEVGAGVVLQALAVLMIALSVSRAGMDTAVVFLVPRLVGDAARDVRGAVTVALVTPLVVGTLCAGAVALGAQLLRPGTPLTEALLVSIWVLPLGATTMVALALLRSLGDVVGFVVVGQVAVPLLRPVGVLLAVAWGGAAVAATFAWSLAFVVGLVLVLVLVHRRLHRTLADAPDRGSFRPRRHVVRTLGGFAGPRVLATTMEQALVWLDVLLVGLLVSTAAAGVYGTASRFVAAGLVIDTALRIVVAPIISRLLHEERYDECQRLFSRTTLWLVLFSAPVYLVLAVYAPVVLGWLGTGFTEGATALVILCIGTSITLAAGNIHSVLLMSGRSGWSALNKAVVLVINVGGNLILLPRGGGIEAAAALWSISMLVDAVMASVEVRATIGLRLSARPALYAFAVVALTVGVPAAAARWLIGPTTLAVVVTVVGGGLCLGAWCLLDRRRLGLDQLTSLRGSSAR